MKILFRVSLVVGLVLLGLVLWSIDRQRTWEIISGANLYLVAVGLAITSLEALCKALKIRSLARSQSDCSMIDALVVYFVGIPFGAVTPGKAGDFVKVYSLSQRTHIGLPEACAVGVLDRLLDMVALLVFGTLGALLLLANHAGNWVLVWAIAACVAVVAMLGLMMEKGVMVRLIGPALSLLSSDGLASNFGSVLKRALEAFYIGAEMAKKARGSLAAGLIFALLASVVISTRTYVFGAALGLKVAWLDFVLLTPLVILVELLPVSVLGLGTREYAMITVLAFLGVDREQAVSLSLSAFVLSLTPLAVVGYLVAVKEHLRPSEVRSEVA